MTTKSQGEIEDLRKWAVEQAVATSMGQTVSEIIRDADRIARYVEKGTKPAVSKLAPATAAAGPVQTAEEGR